MRRDGPLCDIVQLLSQQGCPVGGLSTARAKEGSDTWHLTSHVRDGKRSGRPQHGYQSKLGKGGEPYICKIGLQPDDDYRV